MITRCLARQSLGRGCADVGDGISFSFLSQSFVVLLCCLLIVFVCVFFFCFVSFCPLPYSSYCFFPLPPSLLIPSVFFFFCVRVSALYFWFVLLACVFSFSFLLTMIILLHCILSLLLQIICSWLTSFSLQYLSVSLACGFCASCLLL